MTKKKLADQHVIRVVLSAPRRPAELVIFAQVVHDKMAENVGWFPTPDPSLATLQSLIDDVKQKAADVRSVGVGGVTRRDAAQKTLLTALNSERAYVEKVAIANPASAAVIAQAAHMNLRKAGSVSPPVLLVEHGDLSGSLRMRAGGISGATVYAWQYSLDGGLTWIDMPKTTRASTRLGNLAPKTTVHVRFRALMRKTGYTDWSVPVPIIGDLIGHVGRRRTSSAVVQRRSSSSMRVTPSSWVVPGSNRPSVTSFAANGMKTPSGIGIILSDVMTSFDI